MVIRTVPPAVEVAIKAIIITVAIMAIAGTATSYADRSQDNPIRNSERHLEENRQAIRDLVETAAPTGDNFKQEVSHQRCDYQQKRSNTPDTLMTVCTIEYALNPKGTGIMEAEYIIEMKPTWLINILAPQEETYPILDAYLDATSVRVTRKPIRLEQEAGKTETRDQPGITQETSQ